MAGCLHEMGFELFVDLIVDAHTRVPLGGFASFGSYSTATVADRIAVKVDWMATTVFGLFEALERMVALGGQ